MSLTEELITVIWRLIGVEVATPLIRLTYADAMNRFGTDKPDLRWFGQELVELTDYFAETLLWCSRRTTWVRWSCRVERASRVSSWTRAGVREATWHRGLAYVLVNESGGFGGPVAKNLSESERTGLTVAVGAAPGDCIFGGRSSASLAQSLLGATRLEIGRRVEPSTKNAWAFCWVVDAPLFEPASVAMAAGDVTVGAGAWTAVHHAFTALQDLETFDTDPGSARLRVRHRLQWQRDRRRLHPYPSARHPRAGCSR